MENKFSGIKISTNILMPNHVHMIIVNARVIVAADLRVCPDSDKRKRQ